MKIEPYLRMAQYAETDQMGIIHHSNYVYWMEEARVDFMEKAGFGYERAVAAGIDFAVTGLSCQYKSMCRFHEVIEIQAGLSLVTPTRLTVSYRMYGAQDRKLRFIGESMHCYFSAEKQRPVALNRELPELYDLLSQLAREPLPWEAPGK